MPEIEALGYLVNERPCEVLMAVQDMDEPYSRDVAREVGSSYPHISNVVDMLKSNELVMEKSKQGRKQILGLTELGEEVTEAVETLYSSLEGENFQ